MIRRIGFRRLLPIIFTLAHATLISFSLVQGNNTSSDEHPKTAHFLISYQENSVEWQPMEPQPLTPTQRFAMLFNLPAFVLGIPVALWFFHGRSMGLMYGALPFVPLLWYSIGRWLDRMFGYIPQPERLHKKWRTAFAVLSGLVLFAGVFSISPINHHHRRRLDTYIIGSSLIVWSGLFLAISTSGSVRLGDNRVLAAPR